MKKYKVISVLFIMVSISIIFSLYKHVAIQWLMCKKWHVYNDNQIVIGRTELELPNNWWVSTTSENLIGLSRVPSNRTTIFGLIYFLDKELSKDELCRFAFERDVDGERAVKIGEIMTSAINGEAALSIKFKIISPTENSGKIIWTLSVPTQKLVINLLFLNEDDESTIVSELFSRVRFRGERHN